MSIIAYISSGTFQELQAARYFGSYARSWGEGHEAFLSELGHRKCSSKVPGLGFTGSCIASWKAVWSPGREMGPRLSPVPAVQEANPRALQTLARGEFRTQKTPNCLPNKGPQGCQALVLESCHSKCFSLPSPNNGQFQHLGIRPWNKNTLKIGDGAVWKAGFSLVWQLDSEAQQSSFLSHPRQRCLFGIVADRILSAHAQRLPEVLWRPLG